MKTILHLGLPKTGSSFLQNDVFSKLKKVNIVFKFRFMQEAYDDWLYNIVTDINKPIRQEEVNEKLSNYFVNNEINLISNEMFYCGHKGMFQKVDNRLKVLNRIYQIFPDAKVILAIRNKKTLLLSWYKQYIASGGILSFDEFIEDIMNLEKLNYEPYINKLADYYGKENLYIFSFEDLLKNTNQIISEICNFIGCEVPVYKIRKRNVGYGKNELKASLILNRFFKNKNSNNGLPYPYNYFLLPHRIIFQSRFFSIIPREKIDLNDLTKSEKTKKCVEIFFKNNV